MSCQKKYTNSCPNNPFRQNCNENIEKTCKSFQPFPPRMTDEEFAKKQTELLKDIPKELHAALSYMAWERGHSAGYEEVIGDLQDLVSNLQEPLRDYEARVRTEMIPFA